MIALDRTRASSGRVPRRAVAPVAIAATIALLAPGATLAQKKDWRDIRFPELPAFEVPKPSVHELDNGLTVYLMEDHELPLISVTALIRTGAHHAPAELAGFGGVFGQMHIEGGTAAMTGDELDDWLAERAATIDTSLGGGAASATMSSLTDDFDDVLAVFRDVLVAPEFREDKLALAKTQVRAGIARRNDDVGGVIAREFASLVRGEDSPLARTAEYDTVAAVTRDHLTAWHARFYRPERTILGIVGDFDTEAMKRTIEATFGGWERGDSFELDPVPYRTEPRPGVFFVEKRDVTQANIRLGHLGIRQQDPDYFAVVVLNEVLSGGFTSRLFNSIRTEKGLAYSVFGRVGASPVRHGMLMSGMQTASENMARAVEALRAELVGIRENPPTDEEIVRAKESILNSFVFNYTSRAQILAQQLQYAYDGLPADYLETYRRKIEAVTREQVVAAARAHIRPEEFTVLVVGNPEDFDKPVASLGEVTALDITIPPPTTSGPSIVRNEETLAKGREVFGRLSRAIAGDGEVGGYRAESRVTLEINGQSMGLGQVETFAFPDRSRTELDIMGNKQVIVLTSDAGFGIAGDRAMDLPEEAVREQREGHRRDLLFLATRSEEDGVEAVFLENSSVEGTACDRIAVEFEDAVSTLCVSEDGLVVEQSYSGNHPINRAPGKIVLRPSDYRDVDGVRWPHRNEMLFDGETLMRVEVSSIEIDPELPEDTFARPGS